MPMRTNESVDMHLEPCHYVHANGSTAHSAYHLILDMTPPLLSNFNLLHKRCADSKYIYKTQQITKITVIKVIKNVKCT